MHLTCHGKRSLQRLLQFAVYIWIRLLSPFLMYSSTICFHLLLQSQPRKKLWTFFILAMSGSSSSRSSSSWPAPPGDWPSLDMSPPATEEDTEAAPPPPPPMEPLTPPLSSWLEPRDLEMRGSLRHSFLRANIWNWHRISHSNLKDNIWLRFALSWLSLRVSTNGPVFVIVACFWTKLIRWFMVLQYNTMQYC